MAMFLVLDVGGQGGEMKAGTDALVVNAKSSEEAASLATGHKGEFEVTPFGKTGLVFAVNSKQKVGGSTPAVGVLVVHQF